ncbi:MAG TPA: hypothetical protein V6D22_08475 [Candidatus Obscuribacterales bacterium]
MRKASSVAAKTVPAIEVVEYEVFHSRDDFFVHALDYGIDGTTKKQIRKAFYQGQYKQVHTFERPAEPLEQQLEEIFHDSQNLDEAWHPTSNCRSTSVGDLVKVLGTFWIVAPMGFDKGWKE